MSSLFGLTGAQFVQALRGLDSDQARLQWELCTVSCHSPGPVSDAEDVVRCCDTPVHINPDGTLTPAAFNDVEAIGLSVRRANATEPASMWAAADRRLANRLEQRLRDGKPADNRQAIALATMRVGELRSLHHLDGTRMFGVFDTGLPTDPHHADVVCLDGHKQRSRAARAKLYALAKVTMRGTSPDASSAAGAPITS